MQGRMGGPQPTFEACTPKAAGGAHRVFVRGSEIRNPQPSNAFVFVDESEYVIDDGYFIVDAFSNSQWQNYPSSRHNRAGGFSFADGHAEIHRWAGDAVPSMKNTGGFVSINPNSIKDKNDLNWVQRRFIEADVR